MSAPMSSSSSPAPSALAQKWAAFNERERVLVVAMALALIVLIVWLIAVRPALRTLGMAPQQRALIDAQSLQMQALAGEAAQLRALPPVPQQQAEQVLKSATQRLGARAKLAVQNERATLTLTGVTGEELRQWLIEARGGAHARPTDMQLTRTGEAYNGTLVVAIGSPQ